MKNFKEIAEKCLAGELSGVFVFQNGQKILSSKLQKFDKDASYDDYPYYIDHICTLTNYGFGYNSDYNVIDFISDKMTQKKIEIDIPEGKVPVMEQTESGVVITWANKDITYQQVLDYLNENHQLIQYQANMMVNKNDSDFLRKVNVIGKLANIRNYFGGDKPTNSWLITIDSAHRPYVIKKPKPYRETCFIYFDTQEHAQAAIDMLGNELKYLFEPW